MNARGRIILTIFFSLALISPVFADEIRVPFGIYKEEFIADALIHGLDLSGERESDGFIEDRASDFSVFTYKHASVETLDLVKELTWKHVRKDG